MLYKKTVEAKLSKELFKNPTSEYKGTPFWAWNCELNKDELLRQIDILKEMGFGGFHMHSRAGMATEYLSKEFMDLVKACTDKAKKEKMLSYLYDEDRWPSGFAGGLVTKEKRFRKKDLVMTIRKREDTIPFEDAVKTGGDYLLATYDVVLDKDGLLESYRKIDEDEKTTGTKWYAYVDTEKDNPRYNNQAYVDTLNEEAIKNFIDITYEEYKQAVGDEFDRTVPSIFTDEPARGFVSRPESCKSTDKIGGIAWTFSLPDIMMKNYGIDIKKRLPELIWDRKDGDRSVRYFYHECSCEMFRKAYVKQCGDWCEKNGIHFTGHLLSEDNLISQTVVLGEAMRHYKHFGIPGIDMLCDWHNYNTAKQVQSVARQYGKEGVMSELYGVTGWHYDFRGHKLQGDWQAALGITLRVPHLSWVSMKGTAKRDYPASINYQAPWYKEYSYIENHFSRLNTVMTRGKAIVDVAVIHPVESTWVSWGPNDRNGEIINQLNKNFETLTEWLLFGGIDFDFISESLLEKDGDADGKFLKMQEMKYSTVIVPGCINLRESTLKILEKYVKNGGELIFTGDCPKMIGGSITNDVKPLYDVSKHVAFDKASILSELLPYRFVDMRNAIDNNSCNELLYSLREDNDCKWLFIAHGKTVYNNNPQSDNKNAPKAKKVRFVLSGEFDVTLYDTITGEIYPVNADVSDGKTIIKKTVNACDSLLYKLTDYTVKPVQKEERTEESGDIFSFRKCVYFQREEDNVYVVDMVSYKIDDNEKIYPEEEVLRIDDIVRKKCGIETSLVQPWVLNPQTPEHFVTYIFNVNSEIELNDVYLCAEELINLKVNGRNVELKENGWFVDKSIKRYNLPALKKGENTFEVLVPVTNRITLENMYITGDFDVKVRGCEKTIVQKTADIAFSDITSQGMPFYGGNITYKTEVDLPQCRKLNIRVPHYEGALVRVTLDGQESRIIVFAPYTASFENLKSGKHTVEFKLYGNRVNTFGNLHLPLDKYEWLGPASWKTTGDEWSYEYCLKKVGILKSPELEIIR